MTPTDVTAVPHASVPLPIVDGTIKSVTDMTRTAFDDFLFAPIAEGENGMPLSVLSALARLGVDPWLEAVDLSRLPSEAATRRLAAFIAELPEQGLSEPLNPAGISARLIALLPRRTVTSPPAGPPAGPLARPPAGPRAGKTSPPVGTAVNSRVVIFAVVFTILLGAQCLVALHQSPAETGNTQGTSVDPASRYTPASSTALAGRGAGQSRRD
jgi:hypothetical protein